MLGLHPIIAMVVVLIIIILLNNGTIVRSGSSPHFCSSSKSSTCPGDQDRVKIKHPFWIENHTSDDRGDCISYPGFQVNCSANGRPVINLSNNLYYVLSNNRYGDGSGSLIVVDVDIDAQECPQPRRNFSARFLTNSYEMTFFYNCSKYPENVVQHMPCLDNYYNNSTGGRSFAFLAQEISSHQFDWYQNCEEVVVVPVTSYYNGSESTDMNYTGALKSPFRIDWEYPVNCGNCELSGGECLANETNQGITTPFHCNCTDGTTLVDNICPGSYHHSFYRRESGGFQPNLSPFKN